MEGEVTRDCGSGGRRKCEVFVDSVRSFQSVRVQNKPDAGPEKWGVEAIGQDQWVHSPQDSLGLFLWLFLKRSKLVSMHRGNTTPSIDARGYSHSI